MTGMVFEAHGRNDDTKMKRNNQNDYNRTRMASSSFRVTWATTFIQFLTFHCVMINQFLSFFRSSVVTHCNKEIPIIATLSH